MLGRLVLNLTFKTSIAGYSTANIINGLTYDNTFYCSHLFFCSCFPKWFKCCSANCVGKINLIRPLLLTVEIFTINQLMAWYGFAILLHLVPLRAIMAFQSHAVLTWSCKHFSPDVLFPADRIWSRHQIPDRLQPTVECFQSKIPSSVSLSGSVISVMWNCSCTHPPVVAEALC